MNTLFDNIPVKIPKYNKFDLSHERKMSFGFGFLYPMFNQEVMPGDKWRLNAQIFVRLLPLLAPVVHRLDITTHYFFIPNRLVWSNWQPFITGGDQGTSAPVMPTFVMSNVNGQAPGFLMSGSMLDYFGFPVMKTTDTFQNVAPYNSFAWSALPLRGFQLVYDTYFRDQNIEGSVLSANFLADGNITGADLVAILSFRARCWEHDYLTSCLPWTQRGNPVTIPVTVGAPTTGLPGGVHGLWRTEATGSVAPIGATPFNIDAGVGGLTNINAIKYYYDPNGTLTSSSITINALRLSVRLQEFLEKNARGGGRYIEVLFNHWGVVSSDARLQRPEFLGGGITPIVVSEVLQTSQTGLTGGSTPIGTMAGHGIALGGNNGFTRRFEEHGFVLGLISAKPRTAYQQNMPKMFTRNVQTDFPFPIFAQLGEQTVFNFEAYSNWADNAAAAGFAGTFGYQSRYAEMKYIPSSCCGLFREGLSFWTFTRTFAAQPALNYAFLHSDTTRLDPFAVLTGDHLLGHIYFQADVLRKLPYFGVPRL